MDNFNLNVSNVSNKLHPGNCYNLFYDSPENLAEILIPYFISGIENNELCLWVVSESLTVGGARAALEGCGMDVDLHTDSGQLEFVQFSDTFEVHTLMELLGKFHSSAVENGFSGLRSTLDLGCKGMPFLTSFADNKEAIDNCIKEKNILLLSTFCTASLGFSETLDLMEDCDNAIVKRKGRWVFIKGLRDDEAPGGPDESDGKFRLIFDRVNDGISINDMEGRFLEANQVLCDCLGYSRDELLQMTAEDIISPGCGVSAKEIVEETIRNGYANVEVSGSCSDGSTVPVDMSICLIDYYGKKAILGAARDITQRKKVEQKLIEAKMEAESANRVKTDFIINMSHELRTPLNSVIGFSDLLLTGAVGMLSDKQLKYVNNISTSGKHLLQIVNNILDISKLEIGNTELYYEDVSVIDIIHEVKTILFPVAANKGIEMESGLDPCLEQIMADKVKFKQILYNLLNNAIKFTPNGGVVTIRTCLMGDVAQFSVIDMGIGLSEESLEIIFLPFVQVDASKSREYSGTGIGLAIVKRFVEMHGGAVWVESKIGKGSTFTFTIPLSPAK